MNGVPTPVSHSHTETLSAVRRLRCCKMKLIRISHLCSPSPCRRKKKIPPSRVHPKRKPCIARRYPRLCFVLPTSAAVEPRGRPAYLQSDIGFHLKVVGSDMVVYHELSRKKVLKLCFQYMQMRAFYALSFRRCCRLRRNRRC